ncbi:MAG: hypothetical protein V1495_09050 [Pseudomonadota bacterium]
MSKKTPGTDNRVLRLCKLLNDHRVKYLLVGGVAANLHGTLRSTKDIDILVPKERANMAKLLSALSELPYGIAKEMDVEELMSKPFTIVGDDPRVDILMVAGKINFEKANKGKRAKTYLGVRLPFVGFDDLILSKQTGRLQDLADLEVLLRPKKKL